MPTAALERDARRLEIERLAPLWIPPRRLSLAAWADAEFALPAGDANAGRWRTLPYQRALLDAMTDPLIERVTIMKSARVGYTKAFCAFVAYHIAHDPCPILIVQPTIDDAKKHSKEDIAPMLAELPALRGLVAPAKSHDSDNTLLDKLFRGGSLSLVGANSPRGFRRTSRRVVIFDEVDGYPLGAGAEGDQIELGIRRSEYYWNRKILVGSTPTLAGYSRIERLFLEGDQRRRYLPCPHCGYFQVLKLANLKWPAGRPERAMLRCVACAREIEHKAKRAMDEAGEWRADAPGHFTPEHRHASFHIWAGYSYSPNATWGHIATEFVKAQHAGALVFQTFVNTWLGETFRERGEAPPWEPLMLRRSRYKLGTVPTGALFLTAGVDVQRDRLVYEIVGWGREKRSWSIDAGTLLGDTSDLARGPWPALDALLARSFARVDGGELRIAKLAIDSGYNTQVIYAWARRYPRSRVIAVKGVDHGESIVGYDKPIEFTLGGKRRRRGYRVLSVCGRIAKDELYGFLNLKPPTDGAPPPPGFCEFPEYGEEFFKQLTSEELIRVKGRLVWAQIPGRANDALDARIYARAAAAKYDIGIDAFGEGDWRRLEAALDRAAPEPPPPPPDEPQPITTPWLEAREPARTRQPYLQRRRPGSYWRR